MYSACLEGHQTLCKVNIVKNIDINTYMKCINIKIYGVITSLLMDWCFAKVLRYTTERTVKVHTSLLMRVWAASSGFFQQRSGTIMDAADHESRHQSCWRDAHLLYLTQSDILVLGICHRHNADAGSGAWYARLSTGNTRSGQWLKWSARSGGCLLYTSDAADE